VTAAQARCLPKGAVKARPNAIFLFDQPPEVPLREWTFDLAETGLARMQRYDLALSDPAQPALDYRSEKASKSAGHGCRGLCVCDMSGDAKLDLRTRISLSPNMEVTPETLAALAHSGKAPVAGPLAPCEDLRIHTYPIIAHADSEIGITESDFGLNMSGLCMLVRVADRFAYDATSLVTNDNSQLAGRALHDYAVLRH
jgi:hypothetical protein